MENIFKDYGNFVEFNRITLKISSRVCNPMESVNEFKSIIRESTSEIIDIKVYQKADDAEQYIITSKGKTVEIESCYLEFSHQSTQEVVDILNELIDHFKDYEYTLNIVGIEKIY